MFDEDDIIEYLGPTLEQHKGCTLVDIFPGASIFSSRLHQFLQPKAHYLVEPEELFFEPFLKPLLDIPGSKYHHINPTAPGSKNQWYHFRKIYAQKLQKSINSAPTPDSLVSGKFNPNILVIGNASRLCKFGGVRESGHPFGIGILREMSADALSHQLFNRDGPVRMLWWLPERYKHTVIPSHYIYDRSKLSAGIEMAYDVSEVAGVQPSAMAKFTGRVGYTERSRPKIYDEVNRQTVAERMQTTGLVLPEGRILLDPRPSKSKIESSNEYLSPLSNTAETVDGLQAQLKDFKTGLDELSCWIKPGQRIGKSARSKAKRASALAIVLYPQCKIPNRQATQRRANYDTIGIVSDMAFRLINIEAGFAKLKEEHMIDSSNDDLDDRIKTLSNKFYSVVSSSRQMDTIIQDIVEDELAFCSSSPLSMLDCRAYEPLQAETADFYPEQDMTLIDFMPRELDFSVPGLATRQEVTTLMMDLLKNMFVKKSTSVPKTLDTTIGVNAGRDLVNMVPEITDIRKGGRINPNDLRVRALTRDMIEGLAKGFFEWPFRPERWQLTLAHHQKDGLEEEGTAPKKKKEDAVVVEEEEDEEGDEEEEH